MERDKPGLLLGEVALDVPSNSFDLGFHYPELERTRLVVLRVSVFSAGSGLDDLGSLLHGDETRRKVVLLGRSSLVVIVLVEKIRENLLSVTFKTHSYYM